MASISFFCLAVKTPLERAVAIEEYEREIVRRLGPRPAAVEKKPIASPSSGEIVAEPSPKKRGRPRKDAALYVAESDPDIPDVVPRVILEFCCGGESRLGQEQYQRDGCVVFRLTEQHDMSSQKGLQYAIGIARRHPGCFLWASLPCTGGCGYWEINKKYETAWAKRELHIELYIKLRDNWVALAEVVMQVGGELGWEWPTGCSLWGDKVLVAAELRWQMLRVNFNGCMVGLVSIRKKYVGQPIAKPWTISTTSPELYHALRPLVCPGKTLHPFHAPCAGGDTEVTGGYTDELVRIAHLAIKRQIHFNNVNSPLLTNHVGQANVGLYADRPEFNLTELCMLAAGVDPTGDVHVTGEHRQQGSGLHLWNAMITKALGPRDPQSRSPPALKAVQAELDALRAVTCWNEDKVMEAEKAKQMYEEVHFARLFSIVGIKHFELDPQFWKWKGRVVFGGDNVRNADGSWAVFDDVGTVPTNMVASRCLVAISALSHKLTIRQSDCIRAYPQTKYTGVPTMVRLPRPWWPDKWVGVYTDPVCPLERVLYGHPRAGDLWYLKLEFVVMKYEFKKIGEWPSIFHRGSSLDDLIVIIAYVDDLEMLAGPWADSIIASIRREIDMDDPEPISRFLGCVHQITTSGEPGEQVTSVQYKMIEYFSTSVVNFESETGICVTKRKVDSPYAPEVNDSELTRLMATHGKHAKKAPSYLMQLLYGGRMACPQVIVAVQRLASCLDTPQTERWSAECDRQLERLYAFVGTNLDKVLCGELSEKDASELELWFWPDSDLANDKLTTRSQNGFFLEVVGGRDPTTKELRCMPISWGMRKTTSTCIHTQEAETVSLTTFAKTDMIPVQILLSTLLHRPIVCRIKEDNQACIQAIKKGYSPNLRHISKTQKINLGFAHELVTRDDADGYGRVFLESHETATHKGDMFTKMLVPCKFVSALHLINVRQIVLSDDEVKKLPEISVQALKKKTKKQGG